MADSQHKKISARKKPAKRQGFRAGVLITGVIILLTVATGAGGFYLWQQQQINLSQQLTVNAGLLQQLKSLDGSIAHLKNQLTDSNQIIAGLKQQHTEVSNIAQQAMAISNRNQSGWALVEIDYLLRIADRRLQISRDINSAIAAMSAADQRIHELGDLNLFPIRQQLKKDIANLKTLQRVDVSGIAMSIDQMLVHLSSLPFKTIRNEIKSQLNTAEDIVIKNENNNFIDSIIDTVMHIGDIKVHHRSLLPVNDTAQHQHIEQTLRNHFLAARLAALGYSQNQFMHEIKLLKNILQLHYKLSDNRVSQMQKDLDDFSRLNLSPELPNINAAWNILQDVMAGKKAATDKARKKSPAQSQDIKPGSAQTKKAAVLL
jgi:uroporphyrin-3 C-methyltransferase